MSSRISKEWNKDDKTLFETINIIAIDSQTLLLTSEDFIIALTSKTPICVAQSHCFRLKLLLLLFYFVSFANCGRRINLRPNWVYFHSNLINRAPLLKLLVDYYCNGKQTLNDGTRRYFCLEFNCSSKWFRCQPSE